MKPYLENHHPLPIKTALSLGSSLLMGDLAPHNLPERKAVVTLAASACSHASRQGTNPQ